MAGVGCGNLGPMEAVGACDRSLGNVDLERESMLCGRVSKPFQDECAAPCVCWRGCENCWALREPGVCYKSTAGNGGITHAKTKALEIFPRNALSHIDYKGVMVMRALRVRWVACGKLEVLEKHPPIG